MLYHLRSFLRHVGLFLYQVRRILVHVHLAGSVLVQVHVGVSYDNCRYVGPLFRYFVCPFSVCPTPAYQVRVPPLLTTRRIVT
jgi:hypothetical protein